VFKEHANRHIFPTAEKEQKKGGPVSPPGPPLCKFFSTPLTIRQSGNILQFYSYQARISYDPVVGKKGGAVVRNRSSKRMLHLNPLLPDVPRGIPFEVA
jgi:hypothetical protein